jgi:hypothetical protein
MRKCEFLFDGVKNEGYSVVREFKYGIDCQPPTNIHPIKYGVISTLKLIKNDVEII